MSKLKSKKLIFVPISVILILGVLCAVFVPRFFEKETKIVNYVQGKHSSVSFDSSFRPFVKTTNSTLYVNEKTSAVAITDGDGKVVFNSHSESAAKSKLASVISVTFRDSQGNAYIKSSTDNSVEYGGFKIEDKKNNAVTLSFDFMEDKSGQVEETIAVKFYEENGGIKAEIDTDKATLKDGYCIEKISILPGLFSENNPQNQCFYTVPDGCGAQIDLTAQASDGYSAALDVYGSDITFGEYSQGAILPCFAMTRNKTMLTTVIEDGDALSSIYVKHNKKIGGNLYNTFTVTPFSKVNGRLIKGESYKGVISQMYYLSDSGKADYNTVSAIVRDSLTDKGYLPSKISETFVDYPFFVTAIGSGNGKNNDTFTTFENASEMIALLKSKGVRSIALRFAGGGKKGLNSGAKNDCSLSNVLGGEKEYNKLCAVAGEKNSTVWYDVNLALTPSTNANNKTDIYKSFREYLSKATVKSDVATYNSVYSNISEAYKMAEKLESGNVCINDLSFLLYSDVFGKIDRQSALESLKEKVQSLSVSDGVMLAKPAVYLMNQADAIFNVTQTATLSEYEGVKEVPLLQMVLHGSVIYGSEPVNLFEDNTDAVLKAIEYGASPSFVFTYDNCAVLDYGVYATQTAKFYSSVKRMLPLMDMKITSHEQVLSGVYKVTYDYSKVVYINYNPSVVEVNGILVSAKDFVVI